MKEKDRSFRCRSNCVNVPKLADARKENKDRSFRCRSNCINVPKFVYVSIGLDSLRYVEKATGFGGSYREIIMKKFRIFYQTKLGGLYLMVLL